MGEMTRIQNRYFITAMLASILLSFWGVFRFISFLPVLIFALKTDDQQKSKVSLVMATVLILFLDIFKLRDLLEVPGGEGIIALEFLSVLIPSSAVILWFFMRNRTSLVRFLAGTAVGVAVALIYALWLTRPAGAAARELLGSGLIQSLEAVTQMLSSGGLQAPSLLPAGITIETVLHITGIVFLALIVPFVMVWVGFLIFVAILAARKNDPDLTKRVALWRLPQKFIWIFLGSLALVLWDRIQGIPIGALVLGLNILMGSVVLYMMQGFSILVFLIARRFPGVRVSGLFIRCIVFSLFPFLSIVVMLGLPLLGISETWIEFRRTSKEFEYENHS